MIKDYFLQVNAKYLGVFLDEHLYWKNQLAHFITKLDQGIGILSKLRHSENLNILKIMYHSLVGSHLHYGAQLWGQTNNENINKITVLQNQALRKIIVKMIHDSTNEIYKNLKILRFSDSVCMQNCLFMNQIEKNEKIAKSISQLKYCGDNHNHQTRSATRKLLDTPCFSSNFYGTQSAKYHCINDWNNFKKNSP